MLRVKIRFLRSADGILEENEYFICCNSLKISDKLMFELMSSTYFSQLNELT